MADPRVASTAPSRFGRAAPGWLQAARRVERGNGKTRRPQSLFLDPYLLSTVTIAGFVPDGTQMHFIEPVISCEFLLQRAAFELPVPMPEAFGRLMFYPTKLMAEYDWVARRLPLCLQRICRRPIAPDKIRRLVRD